MAFLKNEIVSCKQNKKKTQHLFNKITICNENVDKHLNQSIDRSSKTSCMVEMFGQRHFSTRTIQKPMVCWLFLSI
jgi:hypothetical protein